MSMVDRLIACDLVSQSRDLGMCFRAAELFRLDDLSRCHFDKRRAAEKHLRLTLDEDAIIRKGRVVRATGRGGPKHDCT